MCAACSSWHTCVLRRCLTAPAAAEIGIDRAAVIPGSKARTSLPHQLELLRRQVRPAHAPAHVRVVRGSARPLACTSESASPVPRLPALPCPCMRALNTGAPPHPNTPSNQLAIAAEFGRPVSVHCVRGYGHLLGLFSQLGASKAAAAACLPHAIMLHSYGGSVEEIPKFCKCARNKRAQSCCCSRHASVPQLLLLPLRVHAASTRLRHVGDRFFFSFSAAINGRAPDQLAARIAAVPDDRLLLESDQVRVVLRSSMRVGRPCVCACVHSVRMSRRFAMPVLMPALALHLSCCCVAHACHR